MKSMNQLTAFPLLLALLCGCEEKSITRQQPTAETGQVAAGSARSGFGGIIDKGPSFPAPTIIKQTYIPSNEFFAHTRCRAWRITWPTYPANTSSDLIPTMFSVSDGTPYSFNFLNKTQAANTFKASFNLYHGNKLASVYDMWEQLIHVTYGTNQLEPVRFNKSKYPISSVETWVRGRPELFEIFWEDTIDTKTEIENYQQGDLYVFKLLNMKRYGGIRIVSMTPRVIEVYLAEPNK